MKYILTIDQSTSATKALLFGTDGSILDKQAADHDQIYPQPGWVEHDAGQIWRNTVSVVRSLVERNSALQKDILCVSITNQRETIVVFDTATGEPLHNALVWQCRRGDPVCKQLFADGKNDFVRSRTGLRIDTYFSASKLQWLIDTNPAIAARLADGSARAGTIDAYLVYRLTGRKSFVTDHTNACRTLLYNIHTLQWDADLCRLFKVPSVCLPKVIDSDARAGETDIEGILTRPVPVCGIMGDSQASLFAHRCFRDGQAKVTFGTGSSILINTGTVPRTAAESGVTTLAWVIKGKPAYSLEGIISFSAATIAWLVNQANLISSAQESETLSRSVPDNGGVYLVPAFAGLSAPYWCPDARAAITGLTAHSTRAHIVRAANESISYQIHDILKSFSQSGLTITSIRADGGPTRDAFLMQFTADVCRVTVVVARNPNISPLGAALCGALGMGIYLTINDLENLPAESSEFLPFMPDATVTGLVRGWENAVRMVIGEKK